MKAEGKRIESSPPTSFYLFLHVQTEGGGGSAHVAGVAPLVPSAPFYGSENFTSYRKKSKKKKKPYKRNSSLFILFVFSWSNLTCTDRWELL